MIATKQGDGTVALHIFNGHDVVFATVDAFQAWKDSCDPVPDDIVMIGFEEDPPPGRHVSEGPLPSTEIMKKLRSR